MRAHSVGATRLQCIGGGCCGFGPVRWWIECLSIARPPQSSLAMYHEPNHDGPEFVPLGFRHLNKETWVVSKKNGEGEYPLLYKRRFFLTRVVWPKGVCLAREGIENDLCGLRFVIHKKKRISKIWLYLSCV